MKRPRYRIFKTRNNDYVIKERNCLGGWSHTIINDEAIYNTIGLYTVFRDKPIYIKDANLIQELLKNHILNMKWHRDFNKRCKKEKKDRKQNYLITFNKLN